MLPRITPPHVSATAIFAVAAVIAACDRPYELPTELPLSDLVTNPSDPHKARPPSNIDEEFARLAREEIPGFGGFYFGDGGEPIVFLTDPAQQTAAESWVAELLRAVDVPSRALTVRQGSYDWDQLKRWFDDLRGLVGKGGVHFLDIDETVNGLRIGVRDESGVEPARTYAADRGIASEALRIEVQEPVTIRASLRDYRRPVDGGFRIELRKSGLPPDACTMGFNALSPSAERLFVTNSHCSFVEYSFPDYGPAYQPEEGPVNYIGRETIDRPRYECDGPGSECRRADAAVFSYDPGVAFELGYVARAESVAVGGSGSLTLDPVQPRLRIRRVTPVELGPFVGSEVQKVGQKTGWTKGTVTEACATVVSYGGFAEDSVQLVCQYKTNIYSWGGDSGSPIFSGMVGPPGPEPAEVELVGILWGGPADPNVTWYSSFYDIQQDLGTTLTVCYYAPSDTIPGGYPGCIEQLVPPSVSIGGPTVIQPGATCTWEAVVTGQVSSYYWSGQIDPLTGYDPWYTGRKNPGVIGDQFRIRVDVSGPGGSAWDEIVVVEDPGAPICLI